MAELIFDPRYEQLAIREKKFFKLNTVYNPKLGKGCQVYVVTPKFYARHDDTPEEVDEELINKVHLAYEQLPKNKTDYPETESQRIGWFHDRPIESDRTDRRIHHPHVITPMIKTITTILNSKI